MKFQFVDADGCDITAFQQLEGATFAEFFACSVEGASADELAAAYKGPSDAGVGVIWGETLLSDAEIERIHEEGQIAGAGGTLAGTSRCPYPAGSPEADIWEGACRNAYWSNNH